MANILSMGPPMWVDGATYSGLILRQLDGMTACTVGGTAAAASGNPGVLPAPWDFTSQKGPLEVGPPASGMTCTVGPGFCVVPYTSAANGVSRFGLLTSGSLTVATANGTNPRVDLVVAQIHDLGNSGSFADVNIITGTPTSGATLSNKNGAPAVPTNAIALGYILVPTSSTNVTSGNILDARTLTVAPGGVVPILTTALSPQVSPYTMQFNLATGVSSQGTTTVGGATQLPIFGAQVTSYNGSGGGFPGVRGAWVNMISTTIMADGRTDFEIIYRWNSVQTHDTIDSWVLLSLWIDRAIVDTTQQGPAGPTFRRGNQAIYWTSPAQSTTPSKGSHQIIVKAQSNQFFYYPGNVGRCGDGISATAVQLHIRPVIT